jgi:transcriptional regulator with XRE-family HTH domain
MGSSVELTKLKVKLLEAQQDYGLRQYEIAAACKMHPSTLSEYALGKNGYTDKHLRALCAYFECPEEDLVGSLLFDFPE